MRKGDPLNYKKNLNKLNKLINKLKMDIEKLLNSRI